MEERDWVEAEAVEERERPETEARGERVILEVEEVVPDFEQVTKAR